MHSKNSDTVATDPTGTAVASKSTGASLGIAVDRPDTWSDDSSKPTVLVKVNEWDDQYWDVAEQLQKSMKDAHISSVWRVQNTALWFYYSFHKQRLALNGVDANETTVWHGTSAVEPSVIYNDKQDGFMMQRANTGFRGIYFAEKSEYSDRYAFCPSKLLSSPTVGQVHIESLFGGNDEREIFLSRLLVGKAAEMNACNTLTAPPLDDLSKMRYDTVSGTQCGSRIYIVYENGRAYPEYSVRYYRNQHRDPQRTPYRNKEEAKRALAAAAASGRSTSRNGTSGGVVWEFMDSMGWKPYSVSHQNTLEAVYQLYVNDSSMSTKMVEIRTSEWVFRVNFETMMQANMEHKSRTQRAVQRRAIVPAPAPSRPVKTDTVVWEFLDNIGWTPFSASQQIALEAAYQRSASGSGGFENRAGVRTSDGVIQASMVQMERGTRVERRVQRRLQSQGKHQVVKAPSMMIHVLVTTVLAVIWIGYRSSRPTR